MFTNPIGKRLLVLAILPSFVLPAAAQRKHRSEDVQKAEQRPAADARSFMELFGKLERDLGMAAEKKDQEALDRLLASEFIERNASDPDHQVTRSEWLEKNLGDYRLDPARIRAMTIRAFLGNAVVSFVQAGKATALGKSTPSAEYLIVDLWVINHGQWQIASRFRSQAILVTLAGESFP